MGEDLRSQIIGQLSQLMGTLRVAMVEQKSVEEVQELSKKVDRLLIVLRLAGEDVSGVLIEAEDLVKKNYEGLDDALTKVLRENPRALDKYFEEQ